jgi:hypothetical protein|tara:strand:+ start:610 stop:918 length:309 start_codon:yes stop_codon:yes gene_type:complete
MNKANTLIAVFIGVSTMMGTAFTIDSRYAKSAEVQEVKKEVRKVDKRLELKILKDRADYLQERIWKYEDRYADRDMPKEVKEMIRTLQKEFDEIMKKITEGE